MDLAVQRKQTRQRVVRVLLAVLLAPPALAGAWHLWVNRDRGPEPRAVQPLPWKRTDLRPGLIHLQLRGEGHALGMAMGQAMGPEIREIVRFLKEDLVGGGVLGTAQRDVMLSRAWRLDACAAPRFREELKGMAEAAGVSYADLLLVNTFDDLSGGAGCSSAVLSGGEAPLLHARNLDYGIPKLAQVKVILDIETRGRKLRLFGFPGYIGALTGMSSRGLALGSHTSRSRAAGAGEPCGLLYRRCLEEAGSLEEAVALLRAARRTQGNNLSLSDGPRHRALAVELDPQGLETREPEQDRLIVTNHFWTAPMKARQDAAFHAPGHGTQTRVRCLMEALPDGRPDLKRLEQAFGQEGATKAWKTPANSGTVQSVIMEPATGRAWVATGSTPPVTRGERVEVGGAW